MPYILHEHEIECVKLLEEMAVRLNPVLEPWGFHYEFRKAGWGHRGAWACGEYVRGNARISLTCDYRCGWNGITYHYQFPDEWAFSWHYDCYVNSHENYMELIGHRDDCHLIRDGHSPAARDGGDPIDALIHDLTKLAAPTLSVECDEFKRIIHQGIRTAGTVEWKDDPLK